MRKDSKKLEGQWAQHSLRRLLSFVMVLALVLGSVPMGICLTGTWAEEVLDVPMEDTIGETEDVLEAETSDDVESVVIDGIVWKYIDRRYEGIEIARGCDFGDATEVEIPSMISGESVTAIGRDVFKGCSGLTSITIPEGVKIIRYSSFSDCSGLTSITIPKSVTVIGGNAFSGCSGLASITVNEDNTVYKSEGNAIIKKETNELIAGCKNTVIPNGVTSIESSAFRDCSGLTSIRIPDSVTCIEEYAFKGCSGLTEITIPESVIDIYDHAFYGCSGLKSITIPENVTSIEWCAFSACSGLESISVDANNSVYTSGNGANAIIDINSGTLINGCKNTKIPENVTSIEGYAFYGCSGLESISVDMNNPVYTSGNGANAIIDINSGTLIRGCKNTKIPETVTSIGKYAFSSCSGLPSIMIPKKVTSIGDYAFSGCSSLESISVDVNNSVYTSGNGANAIIDINSGILISGCKNTKIPSNVKVIGEGAFAGSGLTNITIPETVTGIGESAFMGCKNLKSVVILGCVKTIWGGTFSDCSSLESLTFPVGLERVYLAGFPSCKNIRDIYYTGTESEWKKIEYAYELYLDEDGTGDMEHRFMLLSDYFKDVTVHYEHKVVSSSTPTPPPATEQPTTAAPTSAPTAVPTAIPTAVPTAAPKGSTITKADGKNDYKVTKTGKDAAASFQKADKKAATVTVPATVKDSAGTKLKVTQIAASAFKNDKKVKKVTIGANITTIGKDAFNGCSKLKTVTIKGTKIKSIKSNAFKGLPKTATVKVPKSKKKEYKKLLRAAGFKGKIK